MFIKETGAAPCQYLTDMRITYAKRLLHLKNENRLTIQDIAWMSGFANSLYYSRVFKKATGVSPKSWK